MTRIFGQRARGAALLAGACIVLLCALGLGLRLRGLDYLLPSELNRDGLVVVRQVELMHAGVEHPEQDRLWALYPHLMSRLVALFPDEAAQRLEPSTLEQDLERAKAPWTHGRLVAVILSLLVVPGTYLLARSFLGRIASLFAAGLMTTSLFHMHVSTQEKPHAIVASFLLLSIVAAIRLRRRGDIASYLLCGTFVGLALGSLHDGVAALLPLCAAYLLREPGSEKPGTKDSGTTRASGWWIVASFTIIFALVRVFYPFHFAGGHAELAPPPEMNGAGMSLSGHRVWFGLFNGGGFPRVFGPVLSCDPVLLALAVVGTGLWSARAFRSVETRRAALRGDLAVVFAFALPFLLLVTLYAETMGRYAIPLLPLMACVAAYGFERLFVPWIEKSSAAIHARKIEAALVAALFVLASLPAWRLWAIRGAMDTYELAATRIEALVEPRDKVVILPYVDVPLYHSQSALEAEAEVPWRTIWVQYQSQLGTRPRNGTEFEISVMPGERAQAREELTADPIEYFRRYGARYVVLEGFEIDPVLAHVRDVLLRRATRVRRFSPLAEDTGLDVVVPPHHLEDEFTVPYAWTLFAAARMGPTIEIYELPG